MVLSKSITDSLGKEVRGYLDEGKFGGYSYDEWEAIHQTVRKNRDFFENNKDSYFDEILGTDFETNLDAIPRMKYNLTEYTIKQQARIYTRASIIETSSNDVFEQWINIQPLRKALININIDYFLHRAGFLELDTTSSNKKIKFSRLRVDSLIYNHDFTQIMIKRKSMSNLFKFEYMFDTVSILENLIEEYSLVKTDSNNVNSYFSSMINYFDKLSSGWNSVIIYADSYESAYNNFFNVIINGETDYNKRFVKEPTPLKRLNIVPIFGNSFKIALENDIVENDITMSILYSFGLAGVPSELISKLIMTKSKYGGKTNKKVLMKEISNLLAIVTLQDGEKLEQLQTGKVEAMLNLSILFDRMFNQSCTLKGIPAPFASVSSGNEQTIKEKSSVAFTDFDKVAFDEFESVFFKNIGEIIGADVITFETINKSNNNKDSSSEIANQEILLGSNSLTTPINSLMRIHGLSKKNAQILFENIIDYRTKYPALYSGLVGQSDPSKATEGQAMYSDKDAEKGNSGTTNKPDNSKEVKNNV